MKGCECSDALRRAARAWCCLQQGKRRGEKKRDGCSITAALCVDTSCYHPLPSQGIHYFLFTILHSST